MKTALHEQHLALGAKIVEFSGWEMPLYYQGILHEHLVVRNQVGVFDVSHMGRVLVAGPDAEKFVDFISTNEILHKEPLSVTYTVMCQTEGGAVDDLLVYKVDAEHFFLVVNAANRAKDLQHLRQMAKAFQVVIKECFEGEGILAVQGPYADQLVADIFPSAAAVRQMHFVIIPFQNSELVLSRTGYTGEGGFELYAPNEIITYLWTELLKRGKKWGVEPIGLGARDTLRLEMGYALYGHELSEVIAPTESVAAWAVKLRKGNFLGKEALEVLHTSGHQRKEYGVVLLDKGIARQGYSVLKGDREIGQVTSGGYSPSLQQGIALILVQEQLEEGEEISICIRQNRVQAKVVKLPFYKG